jgi:hypothetical protein
MNRSGYVECYEGEYWARNMWQGAVASAIKGRRGQAFLREMLAAMDALPEKKLVQGELEAHGAVCALGSVARARGIDMANIDPTDQKTVSGAFGISGALAREIAFQNDEGIGSRRTETTEDRFSRMRAWIVAHLMEFSRFEQQ